MVAVPTIIFNLGGNRCDSSVKLQIRFWLSDNYIFLEPEQNEINMILSLVKIINMFRRKMPS